ncbi:phage terminase protein [Acetobacter estunensis NRIC 0472]|uniref:Terminase n=2 Tax=Acetobacter estunensis TaxID=104097 RepID=A0A967EI07_9PROT|nr:hypothetical protein [Acetobacter estunensis]NHO52434.1 terminase [Acetobacter estunensis]GBQ25973.1 phage terminase protein [Acetobacter estunensis NRIC 0472]
MTAGRKNTRVSLTNPQMTIYQAGWKEQSRFRVAVCGRRFGKTFETTEEIRRAVRLAVERRISVDNEIWYAAPTFRQARKIFWPKLKKFFPPSWLWTKPRESDLSMEVGPYRHVVRVVGLENYDALRGSGLFFFVGDEWADTRPGVWNEVIRPMLSTAQGHALFIGTPKGRDHFHEIYEKGQDGPTHERGWWSCSYTTIEGGNVSEEEIASARSSLDPRQFRQEYEASFESFAGQCIYAFSHSGSIKDRTYDPDSPVFIGLDFNINPMSATVWQEQETPEGETITFQIDEIVLPTSNTDEMAKEIVVRYGIRASDFSGNATVQAGHISVYPDPSGGCRRTSSGGNTDISILKSYGLTVVTRRKAPAVRDRLNFTNSMFLTSSGKRRAFVSPRCTQSIESYERYAYLVNSSEPDKSGGYDHLVDATGYYLFFRFASQAVDGSRLRFLER